MRLQYQDSAHQTQTVNDICDRLLRKLGDLSSQVSHGSRSQDAADEFTEVHSLIAALPLTTEEFGVALNRLKNAVAYWRSGEFGAVRYELQLLTTSMSQISQTS